MKSFILLEAFITFSDISSLPKIQEYVALQYELNFSSRFHLYILCRVLVFV